MRISRIVIVGCVAVFAGFAFAAAARAQEPKPWPAGLAEDEPCVTQQWSASRTLVWAKPGTSGVAQDAGNWTEYASGADYAAGAGGKPATAGPDANTDIVLPAAPEGQAYIVGYSVDARQRQKGGQMDSPSLYCRHITIGPGAGLDGGMRLSRGRASYGQRPSDDTHIGITGNVTVADGGYIYGALHMLGDKATWLRVGDSPEPLARSLSVEKTGGASVTFVAGTFDFTDGVTVETGRLVLAPRTHVRINATAKARIALKKLRHPEFGKFDPYVWVRKGAALEMRTGSRLGRVLPPENPAPDLRVQGVLQIGKAGGKGDDAPAVIELTMADGDGGYLDQPGGLYIQPTGEVRNFGRLAITAGDPNTATATKGVSIFLEAPVNFGKVSVDCLRVGGIAATDPAAAVKALAGATFGKQCAATGEKLYSKLDLCDFAGGSGTVEFVDGLKTDCDILFPLGERLIVRSKGNRIAQSFDLRTVHTVTVGGKMTEFNPSRALSAEEKKVREVNALWGDVPGKGQIGDYGSQDWPAGPLMVWRRPGVSGNRFVAANWLDEHGRPCFDPPVMPGEDGDPNGVLADILLPAAGEFYQAVCDRPPWTMRHLTIEGNAFFFLTFNITGNLWVKDGGGYHAPWFGKYDNLKPGIHRFLRFDGKRCRRPRSGQPRPGDKITLTQWGHYCAGAGGSLEMIGKHLVNDHFFIAGPGRIIMSEGSHLAPQGARAPFWIQPGGTVVMLQDAKIGVETTATDHACIPVLVSGTLEIGTPEKPITRDMAFPLAGMDDDEISRTPAEGMRASGVSLLVGKRGKLVIHSTDPARARVVFSMYDTEMAKAKGEKWGHPRGIVLDFEGQADLNGVVFDNVLPGGIMATPAQRASWKNVFYGKHNLAEPDKLYYTPKPEGK